MIADIINKSGVHIPSYNRTIDSVVYRLTTLELGKYTLKTSFSPLEDFKSSYDVVPTKGTISVKFDGDEMWKPLSDNVLVIDNQLLRHVDIKVSDATISNMIGIDKKECFVRFKVENITVEDNNKILIVSPFQPVSMVESSVIEFDCDVLLDNQVLGAYINVDYHTVGNPIVKMQVTNTVVGGDTSKPINYNWTTINNGDITNIGPISTERVGKYTLKIKLTVDKSSSLDSFMLYGTIVSMIEKQIYKGV